MPKVLMIAYHFPPVGFSSGVHRSLKFTQYLPENGWDPVVLTVNPGAFERVDDSQLKDVPASVPVIRAFAFDCARHFAVAGRYPGFLALPDRWSSWWLSGVLAGLRAIKKYKPEVIWSTYPIATAHLIGFTLHKLTGIPWVSDFRDSMTEADYPVDARKRKVFRWIEKKAVYNSSKVIFTTPGAVRMYANRYPDISSKCWQIIENGYDEEKFQEVEQVVPSSAGPCGEIEKVTLVHSGLLYPSERDPRCFFQAIAALKTDGVISADNLRIILRASGHEEFYSPIINNLSIDDIVELAPPVSYGEALKEMLEVEGLLLFQASACNHQIPAKVYEYIRSRKPVFAMTDKSGDTASVLLDAGLTSIVSLDSIDSIKEGLKEFVCSIIECRANVADDLAVERHSRKHKVRELSKIFDSLIVK